MDSKGSLNENNSCCLDEAELKKLAEATQFTRAQIKQFHSSFLVI